MGSEQETRLENVARRQEAYQHLPIFATGQRPAYKQVPVAYSAVAVTSTFLLSFEQHPYLLFAALVADNSMIST